jgi:hypothetical protein
MTATWRGSTPEAASDLEAIEIAILHYVMCFRRNVGLMRCHFHLEDEMIAQVGGEADRNMSDRVIRRLRRRIDLPEDQVPKLRLRTYCLTSMVDELLLKIYGRSKPPLGASADDPGMVAATVSRLCYAALYPDCSASVRPKPRPGGRRRRRCGRTGSQVAAKSAVAGQTLRRGQGRGTGAMRRAAFAPASSSLDRRRPCSILAQRNCRE